MTGKQKQEIEVLEYFAIDDIDYSKVNPNYIKNILLSKESQSRIFEIIDKINSLNKYDKKVKELFEEMGRIKIFLEVKQNKKGVSPEEAYFLITDQGKKEVTTTNRERVLKLLDAKKWRLRMMDMYEQGVLEGSTPYRTLLGLEPELEKRKIISWLLRRPFFKKLPAKPVSEATMRFMARTMFKGIDRKLIENEYYNNI